MNDHHYYATFALGWATADTREAAIEKLVNGFKREFKANVKYAAKKGDPGAYIWTVKVNASADTKYKINHYKPVGVDLEDAREIYVTYLTDKKMAYWDATANKTKAA